MVAKTRKSLSTECWCGHTYNWHVPNGICQVPGCVCKEHVTASPEDGPAGQGTHFWFMVIQTPRDGGLYVNSYQGTWTPEPGATRLDMFNIIRAFVNEKDPRSRGGAAVAFDIQPNEL